MIVADVLLLAAIFERIRTMWLNTYKLDPALYLSAAQLSFEAAVKKTKANLELIADPAMFSMMDSGIRGGISMISNRYAQANNPQIAAYDLSKRKSWIKGLTPRNFMAGLCPKLCRSRTLSGWPGRRWLNRLATLKDDDPKGSILTVDLEYAREVHDLHNDYPLAPEQLCVMDEWRSERLVTIRAQYNIPRGDASS